MDPHDPSRLLLDQLCQVPHSTFSRRLRFMLAYRTLPKCDAYCMGIKGAARAYGWPAYTA
jgi:hypothetical protein